MTVRVTNVEVLPGFRVRLEFDDGAVTEADFSDDLWGPAAEPLRDPAYFKKVRVDQESRTIVWPNGFDPDPDVLHGDHAPAPPSKLRVISLSRSETHARPPARGLTAKLPTKPMHNSGRRRTSLKSQSVGSNLRGRRRTSTDTGPST
jgi:hypothetical protein